MESILIPVPMLQQVTSSDDPLSDNWIGVFVITVILPPLALAHTHTYTHTRTHARTHTCTHVRTHAHMHAHTHTCTHTHQCSNTQESL